MTDSAKNLTQLLSASRDGDREALDELTTILYSELHRLAHYYMRMQRPGHTLQATALVNEAYIKLVNVNMADWKDRAHFFATAAQAMRHILVDHARSYQTEKRRDPAQKVDLDDVMAMAQVQAAELVALDDAIKSLTNLDPRQGQIVVLRYFGGLSIEEVSEVLKISTATVEREWKSAKGWLHRELSTESTK